MDRSTSNHQLQLDTLQTHLAILNDEYQDTLRQFDCTLTGTDRVNLETRLAEIDRQMSDIEREIRSMT
jgi:predicted  nucleic acid-binding Zn-ribbon protein